MRKSMSSASRMASFINQKSTCSHLDPYALILRHARWATNHSPHKYKMWERQRGAHIGMELLNSMELAIPRNVGKVVDLRSYLLEPIKDRSSLATIFSVHEVSHAKKTSKSIHPTLPIRNPSCGRLPPWSELILTGWPTFGVMHLVAVTLRADGATFGWHLCCAVGAPLPGWGPSQCFGPMRQWLYSKKPEPSGELIMQHLGAANDISRSF